MKKIIQLLKERTKITKEYNKSKEPYDDGIMKKYDANEKLILAELSNKFDKLSVDFMLETLTHLGWAPCVIYDDDGNWAISGDGFSNVRMSSKDDFQISNSIEAKFFKPTIRKALKFYLLNND